MNRLSPKRRAQLPAEAAFREELFARAGRCEFCRNAPCQEQHELARGNGLRHKARTQRFAVLALCLLCHRVFDHVCGLEGQLLGLAVLRRSRPEDFDLTAFNRLYGNAPNRITVQEVQQWTWRLSA